MFPSALVVCMLVMAGTAFSAPAADPAADPSANPAAKPGLASLVLTQPVAVSYNAFSSVQTHPGVAPVISVKTAPVMAPVPLAYTSLGYAMNYPYVIV